MNEFAYELGSQRSCIRELFEYGNKRAKVIGRENVFDFSLGNPCIPAPAQVNETIAALLQDTPSLLLHGYTSAIGDEATRQAIAQDLNTRFHAGATADDLFIGCGAAQELCAVMGALSTEGSEIIVPCPYFPEYLPFARQAGAKLITIPAQLPDFALPVEAIGEAINENTVAVLINSPNNPSGVVYPEQAIAALGRLLTEKAAQYGHPIYIISDEPYRELCYDGVSAPFIPNIYADTIVCYSYSKSLSLPGERIGYVYVGSKATDAKALLAAVAGAARALGHVCAPALMQKLIARCADLRPDLQAYDNNRKALYEGLLALGYEMPRPQGAFYLFVKAPGGDANSFSQKAKALDLLVVPGDGFGCPGYFRLCYCVAPQTIARSLPLFARLIEDFHH